MPLKHDTETAMVFLLGLMIALAGAVAAFLPPVSVTIVPWAIAFVIAIVYPLVWYPIMKERRADYEFRALHFVPALLLLVWLLLDLFVAFRPDWQKLESIFTWGWALGVVAAAFILLALFCVRVIRQWIPRLGLLLLVFVPFVLLGQLSQAHQWDRQVAMLLWDHQAIPDTGTGMLAGGGSSNLAPSSDGAEEQWRAQLRRMERRRERLAEETSSSSVATVASVPTVTTATSGTMIAVVGLPGTSSSSVDKPPRLPSSGFGFEGFAVVLAAACCAGLQRKTIMNARIYS
jgi:hypothetical protein